MISLPVSISQLSAHPPCLVRFGVRYVLYLHQNIMMSSRDIEMYEEHEGVLFRVYKSDHVYCT